VAGAVPGGGGQAALKSRAADDRDQEIQRLRAKVGEITMNNELLLDRCHRLGKRPVNPTFTPHPSGRKMGTMITSSEVTHGTGDSAWSSGLAPTATPARVLAGAG
jgi:hypothetical protein